MGVRIRHHRHRHRRPSAVGGADPRRDLRHAALSTASRSGTFGPAGPGVAAQLADQGEFPLVSLLSTARPCQIPSTDAHRWGSLLEQSGCSGADPMSEGLDSRQFSSDPGVVSTHAAAAQIGSKCSSWKSFRRLDWETRSRKDGIS